MRSRGSGQLDDPQLDDSQLEGPHLDDSRLGDSRSSSGSESVRIVTARHVRSMDGKQPQAFACRGEWVAARGGVDEMRREFPSAPVHDFGSATIVPGFNDAHQHPTIRAEQSLHLDLSPERVRSSAEVREALRRRASEVEPGGWVIAHRYDDYRSNGGAELTRQELDEACPEHPVLVVHVTLHAGVVNTRALELGGITEGSGPPPGGEFGRDAAGRLTGVLHDQALYDLAFPTFTRRSTVVPQPSTQDRVDAFRAFARQLHAAGITSVGDALVGPGEADVLRRLERDGDLTLRVNALVAYEHFDHFRSCGGVAGPLDRLRIGGVKAFADGAANGGTCLVDEPIEGTDSHGLARVSPAELREIVRDVHESGWRIGVHANGDRAIRRVLDAVEEVQGSGPPRGHRIEHCTIVDDEIIARMRRQGMIAVPFASYVAAHGDKLRGYYGSARAERMFAHRALLDAGVVVAGSSDFPCGPYEPLLALHSCATRRGPDGELFGPSQRITASEALALYTTGSARASGEGATKGVLAPGYLADFVVLDDDPLATDPELLSSIPVRETWVGGERVWSAE